MISKKHGMIFAFPMRKFNKNSQFLFLDFSSFNRFWRTFVFVILRHSVRGSPAYMNATIQLYF